MTQRRALEHRLEAWRSFRGIAKAARTLAAAQMMSWKGRVDHVARHLAWTSALAEHVFGSSWALARAGSRVGVVIGTDLGLCGRLNQSIAETVRSSSSWSQPLVVVGARLLDELGERDDVPSLGTPASFEAIEGRAAEVAALLERLGRADTLAVEITLAASTTSDGAAVVETWGEFAVSLPELARARASVKAQSLRLGDTTQTQRMVAGLHLRARIAHALSVAAVSEAAARLFAMSRAFEASERSIAEQTLALRKLAQEAVTQDMLEVRRGSAGGGWGSDAAQGW